MKTISLKRVRARCWRGYTENTSGWLPKRMSWLEPAAAEDFAKMNRACGNLIEYKDVYRSVMTQIRAISGAAAWKKRLYAPPTKSGHNFGFSIDIAVKETLEAFSNSENPELKEAGHSLRALRKWMAGFGWTHISTESWHFNHLGPNYKTTVTKINDVYVPTILSPDNETVQMCLNKLVGSHLVIDGALGVKTSAVAAKADTILGTEDHGNFDPWFRRVLAGATLKVVESD